MIRIPYTSQAFEYLIENNIEAHLDRNVNGGLDIVVDDEESYIATTWEL